MVIDLKVINGIDHVPGGNHKVSAKTTAKKMARENVSSTNLTPSSSMTDVQHIFIPENSSHLSVTTVLSYCKRKILTPYLRLLSIVGLRPLVCDQHEPCLVLEILSYAYTFQVILFIVAGYILLFMACFRRDRGFCRSPGSSGALLSESKMIYEETCDGSLIFSFLIPSFLHLIGYLNALIVFRTNDDDQLPVLMERVFLSSTNLSNGFVGQKKIVKTLWLFVLFSVLWMLLSTASVNLLMAEGNIRFKWIENKPSWVLICMKVLLVICTLWHDIIQATVISNYCLQAQLLTSYLQFLREKILQYAVHPIEWMRDVEDFKRMLKYFNKEVAPSVCIFTFVNVSYATSGLLWFFNFDQIDRETTPIMGLSVLNVLLWILISIAPFIQAARLSSACETLRTTGQEVRTRPFVHQDTPSYELDSILLYSTSLKLNAKLFHLPITWKYLCLIFVIVSIVILVLGQCHYILLKK